MGVQLLNGFSNMQSYYRTSDVSAAKNEEIKAQQVQKHEEEIRMQRIETESQAQNYSSQEMQPQEDLRSKVADLENISLTFNKEETYGYIGSESGLTNLDMQKAVSDMKKDSILQEYQYFVGSAQNLFKQSEDGMVIPKLMGLE